MMGLLPRAAPALPWPEREDASGWSHAWSRRTGCSPRTARSTSTSTTARSTPAGCSCYGGRTKRRWPPKHGTILVYVKDPARSVFNADDIDRGPSMAPGLVSPEKVALGKPPTDV